MKKFFLLMLTVFLILGIFTNSTFKQFTTVIHATASEYYMFIGTGAPADSNGIFVYRFNSNTGHAKLVSTVSGIAAPSWLAIAPNHRFVFSVSGGSIGHIYAYAFDSKTGKLSYVNRQLSVGSVPCYITTDKTGKWLFVANYSSGSISVFPVEKDGSVGPIIQLIQHYGHGTNMPQQAVAHVHCVMPAPNNKDIFVTDLGNDKVYSYKLNSMTGHLTTEDSISVTPGYGPRHLRFSPDGKYLYVIHEIGGQITVFRYHPEVKLSIVQVVSAIPKDFQGRIWAAEIRFSPDGSFLYAANRDDLNDIVLFTVDKKTGMLTYKSRVTSLGGIPYDFNLTPDGRYLVVGHDKDRDPVVIFKRDAKTGAITATDQRIPVPHAVCFKFMSIQIN